MQSDAIDPYEELPLNLFLSKYIATNLDGSPNNNRATERLAGGISIMTGKLI